MGVSQVMLEVVTVIFQSVRSLGLSPLVCRGPPPQLPLDLAKKELDCCSRKLRYSKQAVEMKSRPCKESAGLRAGL